MEFDMDIATRVCELESLIKLLIKKGIITNDEFSNELKEYINSIKNEDLRKRLLKYYNF
ncbi:hypothetical protein [Clostridium autoethanogenum]|uniref:hypothetical protein n=1 Tax=Clostridium autoethanogenum TaxID=84023 RepID=UPI00160508FC|nr:hypothetical protein [Clostridium autoethanogenum]